MKRRRRENQVGKNTAARPSPTGPHLRVQHQARPFISTTATGCKATPRTFTLTWGVSSNATRYELKQRNDTDSTESSIPTTGTSITLTRSSAPYDIIVYNYQVRGCNAANVCSAWNAGNPPSDYAYVCIGTPLSPIAPLVSTVRYLHTDALGSPVAETNETGAVVKRTRYEAYGAPTDGIYVDGPGYTGHVTDEATRLTYMQQRYYDPLAARFLSLDPVTTDANSGVGFNRYGFANNNPYRFTDPDGRETTCNDGKCVTTADTFNSATSNKQTTVASQASRETMEAGKSRLEVPTGSKESGGYVTNGSDGKPVLKVQTDGQKRSGETQSGNTNKINLPIGTILAGHGHIDSGPNKSKGMVDDPKSNGGLGDSASLKIGVPMATISNGQVGYHEIVDGQLQFSYPEGAMSDKQTTLMQQNLNGEQRAFEQKP